MKCYEVVREIENQCANNQMRDVFFDEVETDDPEAYLRTLVKGSNVKITRDDLGAGRINFFVEIGNVTQKFLFTEV